MKRRTQKGGMISLHYIRMPSLSSCARNDTVRALSLYKVYTPRNTYYFVRVRLYDLSAGLSAVEWRRWTRHYEPNDLYEKKNRRPNKLIFFSGERNNSRAPEKEEQNRKGPRPF